MSCLHVLVKANVADLFEMGIAESIHDLLLSGRAFPVEKKSQTRDGRLKLKLQCPDTLKSLAWVYEEFTVSVGVQ